MFQRKFKSIIGHWEQMGEVFNYGQVPEAFNEDELCDLNSKIGFIVDPLYIVNLH